MGLGTGGPGRVTMCVVFIAAIQYSNGDWMKMTERGHKLNASIKTLQNFTKEQLKIAGLEDGLQ